MRKFIVLILLSAMLYSKSINIAVASNVSYAINEIKEAFHQEYPNIQLRITLSSSGKLVSQIRYGANYHIFMSADMKYPYSLYQDKLAITKPKIYAKGALAYLSLKKRLKFLDIKKTLLSNSIKKIAIANPKIAPYGKATLEVLKNINDDRQSHCCFNCSHNDNKQSKNMPRHIHAPKFGKGQEIQIGRIQNKFNAHEHSHTIAAGDNTKKAQ